MRVLLIDDDVELAGMLEDYLSREGFDVAVAHDGAGGAVQALTGAYCLVVLDVMLGRLDGIETLRRIRAASQVPVLMLTARGDEHDRILGLELGADDYVPKPCTPREPLVAHLLTSLLVAALLARYFLRPIQSLRSAFQTAASGNLEAGIGGTAERHSDELSDLLILLRLGLWLL